MENFTISEAAFEFTIERLHLIIRRLIIAVILLSILFVGVTGGMIFAFLKYESQFETEYYEVSTDGGGDAFYSYIGKDGDIHYGESQSKEES